MLLKIFLITIIPLFPIHLVSAINSLDVVINEVAWMGSEVSYSDEWIELRNMTSQDIDISGWVIENASKKNGSLEIPRDGEHIIPLNGYYLISYYSIADNILEPKTIINVITDWRVKNMGVISLANNYKDNGELKLRDNKGTLIDQTPSSDDGWPAGNNKTKQTMERTNSGDWQDSQEPNGTPRAKNSVDMVTEPPLSSPEEPSIQSIPQTEPKTLSKLESPQQSNSESIVYPSGILINEVVPSPQGPDSENEWIEIYNQNDYEVNLLGWIIKDTTGSTKSYTLNAIISPYGYLLLKRPETKITLNNDNDGLVLLNPNEETIDSVSFGKAPINQSYSKASSGWAWTTSLTPGSKNIITKNNKQRTVNNKQSLSEDELNTESTEALPRQIKLVSDLEKSSKVSLFLIAFTVALLSSISFLIIKNNLKNFWY